jgi:hypothetical protein
MDNQRGRGYIETVGGPHVQKAHLLKSALAYPLMCLIQRLYAKKTHLGSREGLDENRDRTALSAICSKVYQTAF